MAKIKPVPVRIVHDEPRPADPYVEPDSLHMSVRKIDNGWLVNEYGWEDGKRFDRTVFHSRQPLVRGRGASRHEPVVPPTPKPAPSLRPSGETRSAAASAPAAPKKASPRSPLNVPSDAPLPPKPSGARARNARLMVTKL